MTRLSILIPCPRGAEQSEETLVPVLQNRPEDSEILVVHALPYGDPYRLADEVQFLHVPGRPGIVDLVNTGIDAAEGDVVHVLACGMIVPEGWAERALVHFADPHVGAVAPLIVGASEPTRIESLGVRYAIGGQRLVVGRGQLLPQRHRLADQVLGSTLAAGFYSRDVLDALGGFAPEVGDELADVDLALSLSELGFRTAVEPECKVLAAASCELSAAGAFTCGRQLERLFLRHAPGAGALRAVLAHPLAIAADLAAELPRPSVLLKLMGRLVASWEFGTIRSYKQRLAEAIEYLSTEPTLEDARRLFVAEGEREVPVRRAA